MNFSELAVCVSYFSSSLTIEVMPLPQSDDHGTEFNCPHCGALVRADWEQLSQAVECPHCHMPFEPPTPRGEPRLERSELAFRFQCLRCGSVLEAQPNQSGHSGKCPSCGGVFIIPEVDPLTGLARTNADPTPENENPVPVHAYAAAGDHAPRIIQTQNETLVIECPRCQRESPVTADKCHHCGLPFTLEGADENFRRLPSSRAQFALVCGILAVSLSFCGVVGIVPGLLAVWLGVSNLRTEIKGSLRLGQVGIALGTLGCMISVFMFYFVRR